MGRLAEDGVLISNNFRKFKMDELTRQFSVENPQTWIWILSATREFTMSGKSRRSSFGNS